MNKPGASIIMPDLQELSLHNKRDDGSEKKVFHIIGKITIFFESVAFAAFFEQAWHCYVY